MKKLIIDRSIWRTGGEPENGNSVYTGKGSTQLLNQEGFMCCLGMVCEQMGVPRTHFLGVIHPEYVFGLAKFESINNFLVYKSDVQEDYSNTTFTCFAMDINDDKYITSEKREAKLKEHFATKGIEIEFINDYIKE
jgi:hypothetical protein